MTPYSLFIISILHYLHVHFIFRFLLLSLCLFWFIPLYLPSIFASFILSLFFCQFCFLFTFFPLYFIIFSCPLPFLTFPSFPYLIFPIASFYFHFLFLFSYLTTCFAKVSPVSRRKLHCIE